MQRHTLHTGAPAERASGTWRLSQTLASSMLAALKVQRVSNTFSSFDAYPSHTALGVAALPAPAPAPVLLMPHVSDRRVPGQREEAPHHESPSMPFSVIQQLQHPCQLFFRYGVLGHF